MNLSIIASIEASLASIAHKSRPTYYRKLQNPTSIPQLWSSSRLRTLCYKWDSK